MKRLISLVLSLCMVISMLPVSVFAAEAGAEGEEIPAAVEDGTEAPTEEPTSASPAPEATDPASVEEEASEEEPTEEPTEEDGSGELPEETLVASGTCGGEDEGDNLTWTLDDAGLLTISGEGAMADYGSYSNNAPWYAHRGAITSACIADGVATIGNYAFLHCGSLTSVTIPDSVTTIGSRAFYYCSKLASVTIPDGVTTIGIYTFYDCDSLTSVTIPDSVTSIGSYAFSYCSKLASVTIPDSVTTIGICAFCNCGNLTSVTIPDSVTSIGGSAFSSCDSLASVTIPDSVTSIGSGAFDSCTSLTAFNVDPQNPSYSSDEAGALFDKEKTVLMQFPACSSCTEYAVPDSVTSIGSSAFYYCDSLTSVTIPDGVTTIGSYAFYYCDSLTSVTIPDGVTTIGSYAFRFCRSLTSVTIPDSVTTIGSSAFDSCDSLTSVTIGDGVTAIGSNAFDSCTSLTAFNIDPQNPSYSSDEAGALFDKAKTLLIQFPVKSSCTEYAVPDGVTTIGSRAFYNCRSLTSVNIPDGVTSIRDSTFYNCWNLTSVTIPDSVASIGDHAFYNCSSLTSITIPEGVTSIGYSAFSNCSWLTSVTIPGSATSIGSSAFYSCGSLTSVTIPDSVTSIGSSAFEYCDSLTAVTIGDGVTYIGSSAFEDCDSLTSVTIPAGVTYLGYWAFAYCDSLTSVTFKGPVPQYIGSDVFRDVTATVYYPDVESSWTTSTMQQYGGTLTWEPYTPNDYGFCGKYGNNLSWRVNGSGTLTISGSGPMADYDDTFAPWSSPPVPITTLVIGKDVTGIGLRAFTSCYALETIVLEEGNTSFQLIDGVLFNDDGTELLLYPRRLPGDSYRVPEGVTTIAGYAFYSCDYLTELTFPASLERLEDYAVSDYWESLERIWFLGDAPVFAENAFEDTRYTTCHYYGDRTNWPSSKLQNYGGTLMWNDASVSSDDLTILAQGQLDYNSGYWTLTSNGVLTIPSSSIPAHSGDYTIRWYPYREQITQIRFTSSQRITIGKDAFRDFTALKTVTFPTAGCYSVGSYAFAFCDSLEEAIFPGASYSIIFEEGAFYGCSSLKTLAYPTGATIGAKAFSGCTSLKEIYFTNGIMSRFGSTSLTDNYADDAFTGVTATVKYPIGMAIYIPTDSFGGSLTWESTPYGYCTADIRWAYDSDTLILTLSGEGELPEYVSGSYTPWTCRNSSIVSAVVEDGITTLPPYTFEYVYNMRSVQLPDTLESMATNAFNECERLNNLRIPGSVRNITGDVFKDCYALTDVYYEGNYQDWQKVEYKTYFITSGMTLHKLVRVASAATCTQPGLEAHYRFDDYDEPGAYPDLYDLNRQRSTTLENDPPIPHLFTDYAYNDDATCLADGTETALCDYDCGTEDVRQAEGTMLEHLFTVYSDNGDATCLADGTETSLCDYGCGTGDTRTVPGTMLDHLFTQYLSDGNATCLADGTKTALCDYGCGASHQVTDAGSMLAHTAVTDEAKAPTCTETGLTEGSHCSACGTVFVAQTEVPALGHTEVTDAAKDPTCTDTGLTAGVHCSVCGEVLTAQTEVPALGHTEVIDAAKAPTCTGTGLTEGVHCAVCGEALTAQTEVPALGHTEVIDAAKAPTCIDTGLTAGVHCSVCGEVLTAQTVLPANGHTSADPVTEITTPATCTLPGVQDTVVYCAVCSAELSRVSAELPATGHTEDPALRVSGLGYDTCTCAVCGESYVVWQDARLQYITLSGMTDLTLQDGNYPWVYNSDLSRFESGNCRVDSSSSEFTLTFTLPENALVSFGFGVSSESNYDKLSVSDTCGGQTVFLVSSLSGVQSGSYSGVRVPGEHRLSFSYSKDGSVSNGSDLGWFSDLCITVCTHPEYAVLTVAPTCTETGRTTYTCTACGYLRIFNETPALGHSWGQPSDDFYRTCSVCSAREQVNSISGTTTDGLTWELTANGTLTVSGSGNCTDGSAWAAYTNRITSFVAASGVTGIFEEVLWDLSLTSVTLSETVLDLDVEALSSNSEDLAQITVHADNPAYSASGNVLFNKAQTALLLYPAGKTDSVYSVPATVLRIDDYAFRNCARLTALFLPTKLEQLGSRCFAGCTGLQNIVLDSSNGFFTCDRNTALIRKEDGALVLYCPGSLQSSYTVPNGVTYIASFAFADTANLKSLSLPLSLDEIESSAFVRCESLASVTYPGTEAYWNHSVTVQTKGNTALTEAAFTYGTMDILSGKCGNGLTWQLALTPSTLTVSGKGEMIFPTFSGLLGQPGAPWPKAPIRSVVIGEGITSVAEEAFHGCTALTQVTLPASLASVGDMAFYRCPVETVHYTGSEPKWGLVQVGDGNPSLLSATFVFDSYLLVEWNSSHTVLSISEKVEDSAYVMAAFYDATGRMVLAKYYTAEEVSSGVGISSSAVNLKLCTAKVMVLDEHLAPVGVAYTPDTAAYTYRKAWLYATEHAYIDGGAFASRGTLRFSDGITVTEVSADLCDLDIDALGQEYFLITDPATGEVVSVQPSGGSVTGFDRLYECSANTRYTTDSNQAAKRYFFSIGSINAPLDGDNIPCLTLTPDSAGVPGRVTADELYDLLRATSMRADEYRAVDKDGDGDIDYLTVTPVIYARVDDADTHNKYGRYVELTDAAGSELPDPVNDDSRWYLSDTLNLSALPDEGDILKLRWLQEEGIYDAKVLAESVATFTSRSVKGYYGFGSIRYYLADACWTSAEALGTYAFDALYAIVTDGELLLRAEPTEVPPLDAATLYGDGASINEDAKDAVELLYALDLMKGDHAGNFNPDSIITRAEVAVILYRICTGDVEDEYAALFVGASNFTDVADTDWYSGYVGYCSNSGIIRGDSDGTFRPHDPITTAEAARWLLAAIGYDGDTLGYYDTDWEQNVLRDAVNIYLLENYLHSTNGATTRQWLAVMLENMLTKAYTIDKMVPGDPSSAEYILMGEKYFNLTTDSLIYRQVYGQ
ncbi:MAG: leucine-rich repeat protein [Clostridia bacterium]|nr:leucine-rich repeat protein [Clostridia bacterium]